MTPLTIFIIGAVSGFIAGIYAMLKIDKVSQKQWSEFIQWKKEQKNQNK